MAVKAEAWVLHAASAGQQEGRAELVRETFEFSDISDEEVLAEPLYGGWEGNMDHALDRRPVDICRQRGEQRVVIGNSGVARILEVGKQVRGVEPGQLAVLGQNVIDPWGYPEQLYGYDSPNTIGMLATKTKCHQSGVHVIPDNTRHALPRWGAFAVRFGSAWSNWKLAYGLLRLQLSEEQCPSPHVWGWGGGTTLATLGLARLHGCQAVMMSGDDRRLKTITDWGLTALDRRPFGSLNFDAKRLATDLKYRMAYGRAEAAFLREVRERTDGIGVQIFVDYVGPPVFRATLNALSREGIVTTAGWKKGMNLSYVRASACVRRNHLIHSHGFAHHELDAAIAFAEENDWLPPVDDPVFSFEEIPELAARYHAGELGMFPVYSVASE